jgi:menaquinone-9 beta-reductase
MGVLAKMEADGIAHAVKRGGLISPFGYRCINTEGAAYGTVTGCRTYAIKREIADEYLVRAADSFPSVELMESCDVADATFQENEGRWVVSVKKTGGSVETISCRMLFICDGSLSYLAQKLGIIPSGTQPQAVCSHAYIKGHSWKEADGVMLFNKSMLPGYSALFRHYNDDVYLGTYVLPGGKATSKSIRPFEQELQEQHPYIKAALGSDFAYNGTKTVAPIRTGGVDKSYTRQCLVIGDAAGHVDPLTGEGIHTAMVHTYGYFTQKHYAIFTIHFFIMYRSLEKLLLDVCMR